MYRRALLILVGLVAVVGSGFAGVWFARSPVRLGNGAPLTLRTVVGADATIVKAAVPGRVRLVAVREGDEVKQGQLVAWLEAPVLRDALRAAEDAVKDAQGELGALRTGRRSRPREELARAEAAAAAAQRALEDAEEMSGQASALADRLAAARAAKDEAEAQLAAAEAALAQPTEAASGQTESSGALVSGSAGQPEVGRTGSPDPAAVQAVERARRRRAAAVRELAEARRLNRRAESAAQRLAALSEDALRTATAAQEARARLDAEATAAEPGVSDEDRLRTQVRDAQVTAAQARASLKAAVLVAPAAGLVESVAVAAGQELAEGDPIATIRRMDSVWAELTIPEDAVNRVRRGQQATVRSLLSPELTVQGQVTNLGPRSADPESPWVVRVSFQNPGNRLLPGTDVEITLK